MAIAFPSDWFLQMLCDAESHDEWMCSFTLMYIGNRKPAGYQYPVYNDHYRLAQYNYSSNDTVDIVGQQTDTRVSPDGPWTQAEVKGFPLGVPVQVTMSWSSIDPSRNFLDINGHRDYGPEGTWASIFEGQIRLDANWKIGTDGASESNLQMENLLFASIAPTDEQMEANRADSAAFATSLTADVVRYYSLRGTVGSPVANGDPGITIDGDPDHSLTVVSGSGDPLVYTASIVAQRATVHRIAVLTSGDMLEIILRKPGTTQAVRVSDDAIADMIANDRLPTISKNGAEAVMLPPPTDGRAYFYGPNGGFLFMLPDEMGPLTNSDTLVVNAPRDWVDSDVGGTDAIENRAAEMCVGIPSTELSDGQLIPGGQCTAFASAIWSGNHIMANWAKLMEIRGAKWSDDGTMKAPFGERLAWVPCETYFDAYGFDPSPLYGLWELAWKDRPGFTFVNMFVKSELPTVFVEMLDEYSTDVDGNHVRVFRVSKNIWNLKLAAPINSSATDITLVDAPGYAWQGFPDAPYFIVLQIGDEKIKATGYNAGTKTFTGCVRGWKDTAAVSHTTDETFTAFHTNNTFGLWIYTDHDDTHRYSDLQVYPPGNWDEPEEAGPVDYVEEDPYKIDKYFYDTYLSRGMGVHRVMECVGGMYDYQANIEDSSNAADPLWNYNTRHMKWVFDRVEPFAPLTGPPRFAYFPHLIQGLETYTATLGAAIGPTDTVVQLTRTTDEPDARIPADQMVLADDEWFRIAAPPKDGSNNYTVVRGELDTTPASHDADLEVTVGWRKAITDIGQYGPNPPANQGNYLKYSEIFLDEDLSLTPMRAGLMTQGPPNANQLDILLEARRTFTLTQIFHSDDLVAYIEPDDEDGWDWIKPYSWIYLNGERLVLQESDPIEGTITFSRRDNNPSSADDTWAHDLETGEAIPPVDLPIGTAGSQTSSGPLWSNDDGTLQYYQGLYNYAPPLIVTGAASAIYAITGSISLGADQPMRVKVTQHFDTSKTYKPKTDDHLQEYSPWTSIPYDFHAKMCVASREAAAARYGDAAATRAGDAWVCFPYGATDAMIARVGKIYLNILPVGSKLYAEFGNEIWNVYINGLKLAAQCNGWTMGLPEDSLVTANYHILRSARMITIIRDQFIAAGREDDFVGVLAWQFGGLTALAQMMIDLATAGYTIPRIDAIADAPYTVIAPLEVITAYKKIWNATAVGVSSARANARAVDLMQFEVEHAPDFSASCDSATQARDAIEAYFGWRPKHVCYEGGPGNMSPIEPDTTSGYMDIRKDDFLRTMDCISHPNFRHWFKSFIHILRRRTEAEAISIFCFNRPPGQSNAYQFQLFWGMGWHERHAAGLGDGTDSQADNRLRLWQQGQDNSVNPEYDSPGAYNVSTELKGWQETIETALSGPVPIEVVSAVVPSDGLTVRVTFNQAVTASSPSDFSITLDGVTDTPDSFTTLGSTLAITPVSRIQSGQEVVLNFAPDAVSAVEGDETFGGDSITVTNNSTYNPGGGGGGGGPTSRRRGGAALLGRP